MMANEEEVTPPEWLLAAATAARQMLGLDESVWSVRVIMTKKPNGEDVKGCSQAQPFNHNVVLQFTPELDQTNPYDRATIFHEVVHWSMAEIDYLTEYALEHIPDVNVRKELGFQLDNARERFVSRTSRAMEEFTQ